MSGAVYPLRNISSCPAQRPLYIYPLVLHLYDLITDYTRP